MNYLTSSPNRHPSSVDNGGGSSLGKVAADATAASSVPTTPGKSQDWKRVLDGIDPSICSPKRLSSLLSSPLFKASNRPPTATTAMPPTHRRALVVDASQSNDDDEKKTHHKHDNALVPGSTASRVVDRENHTQDKGETFRDDDDDQDGNRSTDKAETEPSSGKRATPSGASIPSGGDAYREDDDEATGAAALPKHPPRTPTTVVSKRKRNRMTPSGAYQNRRRRCAPPAAAAPASEQQPFEPHRVERGSLGIPSSNSALTAWQESAAILDHETQETIRRVDKWAGDLAELQNKMDHARLQNAVLINRLYEIGAIRAKVE